MELIIFICGIICFIIIFIILFKYIDRDKKRQTALKEKYQEKLDIVFDKKLDFSNTEQIQVIKNK